MFSSFQPVCYISLVRTSKDLQPMFDRIHGSGKVVLYVFENPKFFSIFELSGAVLLSYLLT